MQIIQCVNDTIFIKRFRVPGFGTGSGTLEPVPWNRCLRQITTVKDRLSHIYFSCLLAVDKLMTSWGAFFFNGPGQARARVQPFFFAAPAGPGGPKLARPLSSAVIGHAHLPRFSFLQMASASDLQGKMIIVSFF